MEFLIVFLTSISAIAVNAEYFICGAAIYFPIQIFKKKTFDIRMFSYTSVWLLIIFGLFYCINRFSFSYIRSYFLTTVLVFMAGWVIMKMANGDNDKAIKKLIIAIVLGFAVHALLNSLINTDSDRITISDYFHGAIISATCAGGINTIIFSLLTCLIMEKNKLLKIGGFVCLGISLIYASILASRTQFIILLIVFIITFVLYLNEQQKPGVAMKFLFGVASVGVVLYIVYLTDLFGMRSFIESSNFYLRMTESSLENSDSIRINRFTEGIVALFQYPFGQENAPYYHNMWLDVGKIGGIIPFFCLLLFTVVTTSHVVQIFCCKKLDIMTRYAILSVFMGIIFNLFVEPAMEGMFDIVLTWILLCGAIEYYYYSSIKIIKSRKSTNIMGAGNGKF